MRTFHLKRIAATGALSGALALAALGLGPGTATADDEAVTPGGSSSDWQAYLPLLGSIGDFVDLQKLGVPPEVANYVNLGSGQLPGILSFAGG